MKVISLLQITQTQRSGAESQGGMHISAGAITVGGRRQTQVSYLRTFMCVLSVLLLSAMRAAPTFMKPGCRSVSKGTLQLEGAQHACT